MLLLLRILHQIWHIYPLKIEATTAEGQRKRKPITHETNIATVYSITALTELKAIEKKKSTKYGQYFMVMLLHDKPWKKHNAQIEGLISHKSYTSPSSLQYLGDQFIVLLFGKGKRPPELQHFTIGIIQLPQKRTQTVK